MVLSLQLQEIIQKERKAKQKREDDVRKVKGMNATGKKRKGK